MGGWKGWGSSRAASRPAPAFRSDAQPDRRDRRRNLRFPLSSSFPSAAASSAMPLDGHSYLVSQGWKGHGKGLRQNAIPKPLAIPQKRTLAGLGKDRDEAFPFWDQ